MQTVLPQEIYKQGVCSSLRQAILLFEKAVQENKDEIAILRYGRKVNDLVAILNQLDDPC